MARRKKSIGPVEKIKFAASTLGGKSGALAVPGVSKKSKERLHDRRGRPNAHMKIIEKEAQRRVDADELPRVRKLSVFARELCRWFSKTHPNLPQPKNPLSVANTIRKTWARRKSI
jgi:hypothetical protein